MAAGNTLAKQGFHLFQGLAGRGFHYNFVVDMEDHRQAGFAGAQYHDAQKLCRFDAEAEKIICACITHKLCHPLPCCRRKQSHQADIPDCHIGNPEQYRKYSLFSGCLISSHRPAGIKP